MILCNRFQNPDNIYPGYFLCNKSVTKDGRRQIL